LALLLAAVLPSAQAQSTDGYHAIQVFPLVVDSASFTQRFDFHATYPWDTTDIEVNFYPAQGIVASTPYRCLDLSMLPGGATTFPSLRALCPGLPAGSVFGSLVARNAYGMAFSASSRVSNPAGHGFAAEAFPANTFTSATTAITGLRRLAANAGAPAYQTNCFVGSLAELAPNGAAVATDVEVALSSSAGVALGHTNVAVQPGQLVRLLDVFAAVNAPAGDHDDVVARFDTYTTETPALLTFCTVQDNTSYSADFRIGKQEFAWSEQPGAQDWSAIRAQFVVAEPAVDEQAGAPLVIPAGATRNVHMVYLRHPDLVTCGLMRSAATASFLGPDYGLELRLRVQDTDGSWRVIAGGNNIALFGSVYLGDKRRQGGGANTRYQIEVESNGQRQDADRPYTLVCLTGSGATGGELLRKGLPTTF
jgi:hypothetical protein